MGIERYASPDQYEGRHFADGVVFGNNFDFKLSIEEQTRILGWSHGCPIPNEDIKTYGIEYVRQRYAECNFWYGYIVKRANELGKEELGTQLIRPIVRTGPFLGKYENSSVPFLHRHLVFPLNSPWGYALPRVLIEQFGRGSKRSEKRILKGLKIIDESLEKANTPTELLVLLSCRVVKADADPQQVLSQVLSQGYFDEEQCEDLIIHIYETLMVNSKKLARTYSELSEKDKKELDILDIGSLHYIIKPNRRPIINFV